MHVSSGLSGPCGFAANMLGFGRSPGPRHHDACLSRRRCKSVKEKPCSKDPTENSRFSRIRRGPRKPAETEHLRRKLQETADWGKSPLRHTVWRLPKSRRPHCCNKALLSEDPTQTLWTPGCVPPWVSPQMSANSSQKFQQTNAPEIEDGYGKNCLHPEHPHHF